MRTPKPAVRAPRHREAAPKSLLTARFVLAGAAVLSLAAAFGPIWLIRAAVLVAVAGGVISVLLVWRTFSRRREGERRARVDAERLARSRAAQERQRTAGVLTTLDRRLSEQRLRSVEERQSAARTVAGLRSEVDGLRVRIAELEFAVTVRDDTIAGLRSREVELTRRLWHEGVLDASSDDVSEADVHALPRHAVTRASEDTGASRPFSDGSSAPAAVHVLDEPGGPSANWGNLEVEIPTARTGS